MLNYDKPFAPKVQSLFNRLEKKGVPVKDIRYNYSGVFQIDTEEPEAEGWADYWNENPDWVFGVSPKLMDILAKAGYYAEWADCAVLNIYPL